MTGINRDKLLAKIRALLSKTVANGCSEAEAMAALEMAQSMMDAYEVTPEDLQLAKEQRAVIANFSGDDTHRVASNLAYPVSLLYGVKAFTTGKALRFAGLPSDVEMAQWLVGTLAEFVRRELASYLHTCGLPKGERRSAIHSFITGCVGRISKRLLNLAAKSKTKASGNSTALVVVKEAAIDDVLAAAAIHLRARVRYSSVRDSGAYKAGQSAGDRASFGRGVGRGQRRLGR